MKTKLIVLLFATSLLLSCASDSDGRFQGLPVHVEPIGDNAIRLWVGDHVSSTAVAALNTDEGIVVIDTTESPDLDRHFRKLIAREFGRDDFVYLINTHEHADHTSGNGVYADCTIVAHEYCAEGMEAIQADRQRIVDWYRERISEQEARLAGLSEGTEEYEKLREEIIVNKLVLASREEGNELTFPNKTFTDAMKLDMGDMTIELYAAGGTHTASDIFVFVPEEGLLFTGDMMADVWLTDTPGCLQAFRMGQGVKRDVPSLLANWKGLIDRKDEIRDYFPAHWNGDLTYEGFLARYEYVDTMYRGIHDAHEGGRKLDELFAEFDIHEISDLAGTPGFTESFVHNGTILALWSDATGAESAGNALAGLIEEKGTEVAVAEIRDEWERGSDRYFFLEGEINRMGYVFLGQERYDDAIAVIALNAEFFPESWNVYDSLGEAYMKSGQRRLAVANYNRSLQINPDNDNGLRMLEEIGPVVAEN